MATLGILGDTRPVTIRIDMIKDATTESIHDVHSWGDVYMLQKSNENEGRVDKQPLYSLVDSSFDNAERCLLAFWRQKDIIVTIDADILMEQEQANSLLLANTKKTSTAVSC